MIHWQNTRDEGGGVRILQKDVRILRLTAGRPRDSGLYVIDVIEFNFVVICQLLINDGTLCLLFRSHIGPLPSS